MENASKALLMAGGVLIAILLLTLFAYLFGQMASSTTSIYQTIEKHEKDEFNQQFLNYEGRGITPLKRINETGVEETYYNNLKPQDIATLLNLAKNAKQNSKFKADVKIYLNGVDISNQKSNEWLRDKINSNNEYQCDEVNINSDTLLVDEVKVSQK